MLNTQLLGSAKDNDRVDGGLFASVGSQISGDAEGATAGNSEIKQGFEKALNRLMGAEGKNKTVPDSGVSEDAVSGEDTVVDAESMNDELALNLPESLRNHLKHLSHEGKQKLLDGLEDGNILPADLAGMSEEEISAVLLPIIEQAQAADAEEGQLAVDEESAEQDWTQWFNKLHNYLSRDQGSPEISDVPVTADSAPTEEAIVSSALDADSEGQPVDASTLGNGQSMLAASADAKLDHANSALKQTQSAIGLSGSTADNKMTSSGITDADVASSELGADTELVARFAEPKLGPEGLTKQEPQINSQLFTASPVAQVVKQGQAGQVPETSAELIDSEMESLDLEGLSAEESTFQQVKSGDKSDAPLSMAGLKVVTEHSSQVRSNLDTPAPSVTEATESSQLATNEQRNSLESLRMASSRTEQHQEVLNMRQGQIERALSEKMNMMLGRNMQSAEVRLDPPELGSMMIRVQVQQDQVSVQFNVSNQQAKEALDQAMPRLREMMAQQGIQLGDAQVSQQQGGNRQEHAEREQGYAADEGDWTETELPVDSEAVSYAATGRIDYFA